jgi:site-specific DNA-methyltransferase (adenine-specific)
MKNMPLPRLDHKPELCDALLPYCRLRLGQMWIDPKGRHRVGCMDAAEADHVSMLVDHENPTLAIHDPPYNLVAFETRGIDAYIAWCARWIDNTVEFLAENASLYIWLGADQNAGFQPLPDFMIMMRGKPLLARSFITMRNQRGYGTQHNWMAVRQELLYYIKGEPTFNVDAEYTDIPKILRGYYKDVGGRVTENMERSRSDCIRAGNVWVDIQQVFYRLEENVNGCYAQKPLKSIERLVKSGSAPGDAIMDFFAHSGATLLAAEMNERRCFTMDIDPIFCEISIRRLERYRATKRLGWQNGHPFEAEHHHDKRLCKLLGNPEHDTPLLFAT